MSLDPLDGTPATTPRRDRPPARNEILRAGRLGGLAPGGAGRPLRDAAVRLRPRRHRRARSRRCGPSCRRAVDLAYAVKANPALAVVAHLGRLGLGADVASGGELATALRAGIAPDRDRDDRARASATRSCGPRSRAGDPGRHGRVARRARRDWRRSPPRPAARQPVLLRAAVTEDARLERVRLVGDDGAGKFGMDAGRPGRPRRGARRVAAPRAARAARLRRLERPRRRRARRPRRGDRPRPPAQLAPATGHDRPPRRRRRRPRHPVRAARGVARPRPAGRGPRRDRRRLADATRSSRDARLLLEPGASSSGRPAHTWRASSTARPSTARRSSSSTAGSTTCCGRPSSARSTGSERSVRTRRSQPRTGALARSRSPGRCARVSTCSASTRSWSPPDVGELVAVLDVGAYGFTESMPLFLSHPIPAEVAVRGRAGGADPPAAGARGVAGPPAPARVGLTGAGCDRLTEGRTPG